jgi:hypothetical protein
MHPNRLDILNQVLALDPQKDCQRIVYLVGSYEYPWMMQKSLEFALFRTYAVPSISRLLDKTLQFARHGQKRYDDTSLIIAEITEHGFDSERGKRAIQRMNALHGRYDISNEDFLYVLSAFTFVPIYWHEQFGWRKPTPHENLANYYFWVEVGKRMGIQNIPDSYEAFEQFHKDYEAQYFDYSDSNHAIAEHSIKVFCGWYPALFTPIIREGIYTFMDERLRQAFGYPKPHSILETVIHSVFKFGSWCIRFMPPRKQPFSLTNQPNRTYKQGYEIEQLGS